jgi:hypothetical protein
MIAMEIMKKILRWALEGEVLFHSVTLLVRQVYSDSFDSFRIEAEGAHHQAGRG